jgi:hypothetical protein
MPPIGGLAGDSARRNAHLLSRLLGNRRGTHLCHCAVPPGAAPYGFAAVRAWLATQRQGLLTRWCGTVGGSMPGFG